MAEVKNRERIRTNRRFVMISREGKDVAMGRARKSEPSELLGRELLKQLFDRQRNELLPLRGIRHTNRRSPPHHLF